jgi:hypothetical protein
VAPVRTDVSAEHIASTIRVDTISELGTLPVTINRSILGRNKLASVASYSFVPRAPILTLMMEAICFSETTVITNAIRSHIAEKAFLIVQLYSITHTRKPSYLLRSFYTENRYIFLLILK